MLDKNGFNMWAEDYDNSVALTDEAECYPFAGYNDVLNSVYNIVSAKPKGRVLDIGFGTGTLTQRLCDSGFCVTGIDFSEKMIEIAKSKMQAKFLCYDFTKGFPKELSGEMFDYCISTYAIHHMTDEEKIRFIRDALCHINEGGAFVIGDVAFDSQAEREACRAASGDDWDDEEYYTVADTLRAEFKNVDFQKVSFCAGVIIIRK